MILANSFNALKASFESTIFALKIDYFSKQF
jgi:hypothetical protein